MDASWLRNVCGVVAFAFLLIGIVVWATHLGSEQSSGAAFFFIGSFVLVLVYQLFCYLHFICEKLDALTRKETPEESAKKANA